MFNPSWVDCIYIDTRYIVRPHLNKWDKTNFYYMFFSIEFHVRNENLQYSWENLQFCYCARCVWGGVLWFKIGVPASQAKYVH